MDSLYEELVEKLHTRLSKEQYSALCTQKKYLPYLKQICLGDEHQLNWRAAWLISNMPTEEVRLLFPESQEAINALSKQTKDGYHREILKIIKHLPLNEDEEGALYDAASKLWENLALAPAVRLYALRAMVRIARLYPELGQEILAYNDEHYLQGISAGIARQVQKEFAGLS